MIGTYKEIEVEFIINNRVSTMEYIFGYRVSFGSLFKKLK